MKSVIITFFTLLLVWLPVMACAADPIEPELNLDADSVVEYVMSCRKSTGAFGPADQEYTDAAWNYPAVSVLALLGADMSGRPAILRNGLGHPAGHVGYGHWQFFHQHMIRKLLGAPVAAQHRRIQLIHQGFEVRYYGSPFGTDGDTFFKSNGSSEPDTRDIAAKELGYYNLSSLYYVLAGLNASKREAANQSELVSFITRRLSPCGGFADVRTKDGQPTDDETHVAHTLQAIAALRLLNAEIPRADHCTQFIQSCQLPTGAFRWNPNEETPGNHPDIYYTWAAIRGLKLLGTKPANEEACLTWINSLQNHDGGFGDQPGWRSRLYSTYYAVDALSELTGNVRQAIAAKDRNKPKVQSIPEGRYHIYQGLHKMPVIEAKDLPSLRTRGFHLLALKSDNFALVEPLQRVARAMQPPMDVILCPEAYPHRAQRFGGALLHHICNVTIDPSSMGQQAVWQTAGIAGRKGLAWSAYQEQVIRPLQREGSLFYPEQDFEMEYAYSAYDDGVYGRQGYNAVLAGFNWSPRDFVRVFPWRERYVDKLTPIADADAHGDLDKWSSQLDHTRHLFIAKGPTYSHFQEAAANGRVVCVIHGAEGVASPATVYGREPAVNYVKRHIDEWKWWD